MKISFNPKKGDLLYCKANIYLFLFDTKERLDEHITSTGSDTWRPLEHSHFSVDAKYVDPDDIKLDEWDLNDIYDRKFQLAPAYNNVILLVRRHKTDPHTTLPGERWHVIIGQKIGWVLIEHMYLFRLFSPKKVANEL